MAAITLNIGGNTRQLDRDIQKTVNKVYNINLKSKGDQPLGRITGKVNEFNKSLDASNARVIAFGASAGIIFGVERAFTALVSATIEVQKSLQDINVILNASQSQLQKFGGELFNIARNTGQSFQEVAKAATEFSRQGLGIEETLKRTNEALILSRLSGLDAAKSVESLTAAVNSFASQAVTATEVVNKFATVDAAFAVSSADLADAIARVGSSAAQSGVSLNELIAIVTSAQQTTARGGAVIGNSFKTIFTRLQREKVVDLLESLGISGTDASGQVKSTIQLLQDLGAVYDTLGSQQQAYVAEQVGGVFQINILKAALADLGKEYSIYSSALNVAAGATDQAIRRNEELNKTYSAQINALAENARQLAAAGGERLLGPSIDRLVGGTNTLLEGFSESDGQGVGAVLGKGILDGLGQFIAGPGLALIGGVLLKLFRDLGKFATGSVQQLLGLNTAATQQKDLQQSISQILAKNPQLLELALKGEQGLNQAANSLLANLQKQTVELQKQAAVAQQISKAFVAQAGVRVAGGVPVVPTGRAGKAAGYIPNFANAELLTAKEEGYTARRSFEVDNPVLGPVTVNDREKTNAVPVGGYPPGTFIVNPKQLGQVAGIPLEPIERMKNKASGFIPNFARTGFAIGGIKATEPNPAKIKKVSDKQEDGLENQAKSLIAKYTSKYTNSLQPLGRSVTPAEIEQGFNTVAGAKGALNGIIGSIFEVGISTALDYKAAAREKGGDFDIRGGSNLKKVQDLFNVTVPLADFKVNAGPGNIKSFIDKILNEEGAGKFEDTEIIRNSQQIAKRELKAIDEKEATRLGIVDQNGKPVPGKEWFPKGTGRGYELKQKIPNISTDVRNRIQKLYDDRTTESRGRFGYLETENYRNIQTQGTPQKLGKGGTGEAGQPKAASYWASKYGYLVPPLAQPGAGTPIFYSPKTKNAAHGFIPNFADLYESALTERRDENVSKMSKGVPPSKRKKVDMFKSDLGRAAGFIPNFAALSSAISRERSAGVPSSRIYVAQDSRLAAAGYNPLGLGVFNTRDEPTAGARSAAIKSRGYAGGYIPNFAIEDPDVAGAGLGTTITALVAQLGFLAFSLQGTREQYTQNINEIIEKNKSLNSAQIDNLNTQEKSVQLNKKNLIEQRRSGQISQATARLKFDELKIQQAAIKGQIANAGAASKSQQLGAGLQAGGFALSVGAPIIAETIKNSIGQETAGARRTGEAVGAAGQIASFAGAGAMFGPWGAAIGAATGALLTVPGVIAGLVTDFPELQKAANKSAQEVTKFGESSSRLLQASEAYTEVLSNAQAGPQALEKAQKALTEALNAVPTQYRDQLAEAAGTGKIPEVSAQIQAKLLKDAQVKAGSAQLGKSTGEARFSGLKQSAAKFLDFGVLNAVNKAINRDLSSNISDQFDPKKDLKKQENVDAIQTVVTQSLTGGEFTPEVVKALEKIPLIATSKQLGGTEGVRPTGAANEFVTEVKNVDDLRKFLESTGKFDPSNIGDFLAQAKKDFEGTVSRINESIATTRNETISTVDAFAKASAKQKEYLENVKKASAAIDAASSRLEKNVAIQNLFKSALENLQENMRSFSQNLQIEQTLTQPREVLSNLIGADKDPTRRLAAQEGLAGIRETERSGLATAGLELKGTIREILQKPFQENINKLRENLGLTKEGFKGDSTQIESQTSEMINQTATEYQNLNSVMEGVEGYMDQFVKGQISTQQLLEQSKNELSKVGIDISKGSQASDSIEKAVAELQVKSIQEQVKAFQQRAKLASETKQAILQSRIEQALNTFGGFEGFMNRPEEEGNYIQKISPDLKKIEQIRSSTAFRYNNKDSIKEQEKQAPDLARSFANVYKELINQSGGAFRDFLQQTIDQGMQQTGVEGRSGLAGAGLAGGFDDIVRGRQQDLEQQLKLAEDQIKVTTDPTLKRDLKGFVDSVRNIPGGTKGIAQLQTQKELGVARQSDFAKLYGKYENESLNRLKDISPTLAASLESAISLSDDPLVAEAQLQSALQTDMVGYLSPIQSALLQIANSGGASVTQTGVPKIEGYAPKLTEQQQKKADEFRKKQEEVAKKEADIKAKKAQEAGMPQDNRTIEQIEAETIAARDRKRELEASLSGTQAIMGPGLGLGSTSYINGIKQNPDEVMGVYEETNIDQQRNLGSTFSSLQDIIERNLAPTRKLSDIGSDVSMASYNMDVKRKGLYEGDFGAEVEKRKLAQNPLLTLTPQNITTDGGTFPGVQKERGVFGLPLEKERGVFGLPLEKERGVFGLPLEKERGVFGSPGQESTSNIGTLVEELKSSVLTEGSFAQQEAAFSNNTSALTTLAGGIESLTSTLASFETNFTNLNNLPNVQSVVGQQQLGAQPQISTNTNAPISVIVNPQGGPDIALAIGEEIKEKIPEIVKQVMLAMGYKVPPALPNT
jgi:TP901 family phage tail tape measure protein